MTEHDGEQKVELPDAETFDIGEWISGKITVSEYSPVVYLDKDGVRRLTDMRTQAQKILAELGEIEKSLPRVAKQVEQSAAEMSLTEASEADKLHVELQDKQTSLNKELKTLRKEYDKLHKEVAKSKLTVTLAAGDRDAYRHITPALMKNFPELSQGVEPTQAQIQKMITENPEVMVQQNKLMLHATIKEMTTADGTKVPAERITFEAVEKLWDGVGARDRDKLLQNMSLAMSAAFMSEEAVDAGFPG